MPRATQTIIPLGRGRMVTNAAELRGKQAIVIRTIAKARHGTAVPVDGQSAGGTVITFANERSAFTFFCDLAVVILRQRRDPRVRQVGEVP